MEHQAEPGASSGRLLEAFCVALDEARSGKHWYTSLKQLHLVSLQFCLACRAGPNFDVVVNYDSLSWLLARAPSATTKKVKSTRVPLMRARRATWELSAGFLVYFGDVCSHVVCLVFGNRFNDSLNQVVWPGTLRRLELGDFFNQPIDAVSFSPVEELVFGADFNQSIANVAWPASLRTLKFGMYYNHPLPNASLPPHLQELELGYLFNQSLSKVEWPSSLERITFGRCFNQPIGVKWPDSLQEVTVGGGFKFPIEGIRWPPSLRKLTIGGRKVTCFVREEDLTQASYLPFRTNSTIGGARLGATRPRIYCGWA